jgi:hypothetical protein
MKTATAHLKSFTPYSQSKYYQVPKLNSKESPDAYEKRTWRERLHVDDKGRVVIPNMSFKNCLSDAAKYLSMKVGKGTKTFTKHFEAGLMVSEGLTLPIHRDDVPGEWIHVPSDGTRGGAKRVLKCFPVIQEWEGKVVFYILDETITEEAFLHHIEEAGKFIGIGRFRPRNNGYYGRFEVEGVEWK